MTTHIISASWGRLLDGVSNGGHAGWEAGGPGTARLPFTLVGERPLTTTGAAIKPRLWHRRRRRRRAAPRVRSYTQSSPIRHRTVTQGRYHSRRLSARHGFDRRARRPAVRKTPALHKTSSSPIASSQGV
ncbi:hypothetical protein [Azospirillum argentinense]